MVNIIIHTDTTVVRRTTTDTSPVLAKDETAHSVEKVPVELSQKGYWKLNADNTASPATDDEAATAGVNETGAAVWQEIEYETLLASLDKVAADPVEENLKEFFAQLRKHWS